MTRTNTETISKRRLEQHITSANRGIKEWGEIVNALQSLHGNSAAQEELEQAIRTLDEMHADLDCWIEAALEDGYDLDEETGGLKNCPYGAVPRSRCWSWGPSRGHAEGFK